MSEVEETIKRISSHKGVIGLIVVNQEGIPIRTTLDNSTTVQYAGAFHFFVYIRGTGSDPDRQKRWIFFGSLDILWFFKMNFAKVGVSCWERGLRLARETFTSFTLVIYWCRSYPSADSESSQHGAGHRSDQRSHLSAHSFEETWNHGDPWEGVHVDRHSESCQQRPMSTWVCDVLRTMCTFWFLMHTGSSV